MIEEEEEEEEEEERERERERVTEKQIDAHRTYYQPRLPAVCRRTVYCVFS